MIWQTTKPYVWLWAKITAGIWMLAGTALAAAYLLNAVVPWMGWFPPINEPWKVESMIEVMPILIRLVAAYASTWLPVYTAGGVAVNAVVRPCLSAVSERSDA